MERSDVQNDLALAPTLQALNRAARDDLAVIASMGFRAVQLSATQPGLRPRELDASGRRGLSATLRRLELDLAGIDLWIQTEHFTQSRHVDRAVDAARSCIELAADLGRCPVSLAFPSALPPAVDSHAPAHSPVLDCAAGGVDSVENSDVEQAVRAIIDHAERCGVQIADHAAPQSHRDHGGDVVGWGIDPALCLAHGEDPARFVARAASTGQLVSARLTDLLRSGMRGPPGDSRDHRLDTLAYRVALSVAGYRRPVVLDARQWVDVHGSLRVAQSAWVAAGRMP